LIRLTVVAPNLPLRVGLREMLSAGVEIDVAGEAGSLDEAARLLEQTDILLLAAPQPEDVRELADSGAGPAILLLSDEPSDAQQLAGAERVWGILPLDASETELRPPSGLWARGWLWVRRRSCERLGESRRSCPSTPWRPRSS
jgi:hypothetical protein